MITKQPGPGSLVSYLLCSILWVHSVKWQFWCSLSTSTVTPLPKGIAAEWVPGVGNQTPNPVQVLGDKSSSLPPSYHTRCIDILKPMNTKPLKLWCNPPWIVDVKCLVMLGNEENRYLDMPLQRPSASSINISTNWFQSGNKSKLTTAMQWNIM